MNACVYNLDGVDISGSFKRIDGYLEDNFVDLINKNVVLNEIDLKMIKILVSDLYALKGLMPNELRLKEHLMFKLSLILNIHYISKKGDENLIENFFLIPEKSENKSTITDPEIITDTNPVKNRSDHFGTDYCRI